MALRKWGKFLLVPIVCALLLLGCGQSTPAPTPAPPTTPEPPISVEGSVITHAIDGVFADCNSCHGEKIKATHVQFGDYEDCFACHEAEEEEGEPEAIQGSVITHAIDGIFADCNSCHGGIQETHEEFGDYEDCFACHEEQ